jgi:hypothetical protein
MQAAQDEQAGKDAKRRSRFRAAARADDRLENIIDASGRPALP